MQRPDAQQSTRLELDREGAYRASVILSQLNQRVRVLDYTGPDLKALADTLVALAEEHGLSKVFIKAREPDAAALETAGFTCEGTIQGYYNGADCRVESRFLTEERGISSASEAERAAIEQLAISPVPDRRYDLPPGYTSAVATAVDAPELAHIYKRVFESYPFPIFDPAYLRGVMATHVIFRLVRNERGELVAAASAETAPALSNAEMTDFATLPSERGKHLACYLLQELERDLPKIGAEAPIPGPGGIVNLYTLARSSITGMNRVFHHLGYRFTGRLVKNCHIGGQFEDMLCWCKRIG
jgi:putative beta-lysine N-acetyltransferase